MGRYKSRIENGVCIAEEILKEPKEGETYFTILESGWGSKWEMGETIILTMENENEKINPDYRTIKCRLIWSIISRCKKVLCSWFKNRKE